jgi:hypothetical protein
MEFSEEINIFRGCSVFGLRFESKITPITPRRSRISEYTKAKLGVLFSHWSKNIKPTR